MASEDDIHLFWSCSHSVSVWRACQKKLSFDILAEIARSSRWDLLTGNVLGKGELKARMVSYVHMYYGIFGKLETDGVCRNAALDMEVYWEAKCWDTNESDEKEV